MNVSEFSTHIFTKLPFGDSNLKEHYNKLTIGFWNVQIMFRYVGVKYNKYDAIL